VQLTTGKSIYATAERTSHAIHTTVQILTQNVPDDICWITGVRSHKASRFSHMKSTHTSCSDLGESYILQNFFQSYFCVYAHTNHFTTRFMFNIVCCLSSAELRSTNTFIHEFSTLQQQGRNWIYYSKQNSQNYDHLIVLANLAVTWNTIATGTIKTADYYIYSTDFCSYSIPLQIKVVTSKQFPPKMWQNTLLYI
jgi:hypothetical protein